MRVAVGLSLAGCGEPTVAARAPGLEEAGPAAGEGEGATEWTRALELGDSQAMRAAVAPDGDVLGAAAHG